MKKLILLLIVISLISCNNEPKDYVSISGHIQGLQAKDSVLTVRSPKINKKIKIDSEGNFQDTLKIKDSNSISFIINKKLRFSAFLRNGYDLKLTGQADDLIGTLHFEGLGSTTNNYLMDRIQRVLALNKQQPQLMKMDSLEFFAKLNEFEAYFKDKLSNSTDIDTTIIKLDKKGLESYLNRIKRTYDREHKMLKELAKGKPSPTFKDYENFKGGKSSLEDFKGKYVYIDVWATWCRPCLGQIPALKELEKEYHGKNIEFISISTDKPEKHQAWINMIKSKGMQGTQLFAGEDQSFQRAYQINSIPRFIFIGKNGEILNPNAPRPSQKDEVIAMFKENGLE